jgi:hypothetical protein
MSFLNDYPDGTVPLLLQELVDELRKDYQLDIGGKKGYRGVGFRIDGGRWIEMKDWLGFVSDPELDLEKVYGVVGDVSAEDAGLPRARRQEEFSRLFKDMYEMMFRKMQESGRRVVQNSDVKDAFNAALRSALQRDSERRDQDDE